MRIWIVEHPRGDAGHGRLAALVAPWEALGAEVRVIIPPRAGPLSLPRLRRPALALNLLATARGGMPDALLSASAPLSLWAAGALSRLGGAKMLILWDVPPRAPLGRPLPTGAQPLVTGAVGIPPSLPGAQPIPLPPPSPGADAALTQGATRRRLGLSPDTLLLHCPAPPTPHLRGAAAALTPHGRTLFLVPASAAPAPGLLPRPRWLPEAQALASADALYVEGSGPGQMELLLRGLWAGIPLLYQGPEVGPEATALGASAGGLTLPPGSEPALRVGALSLAADPGLRRRLGAAGSRWARAQLTAEAAATETLRCIDSRLTLGERPQMNGT